LFFKRRFPHGRPHVAKPEGKLAMTSNNNNICWRRLFVIGGLLSFTSAFGQVLAPLSVHTAPQAALKQGAFALQGAAPLQASAALAEGPAAATPSAASASSFLAPAQIATIAAEQTINPTVLAPSARKLIPRGCMLILSCPTANNRRPYFAKSLPPQRSVEKHWRPMRSTHVQMKRGMGKRHADLAHWSASK
jgi:hypothetical protein